MVLAPVCDPSCNRDNVVHNGKGKQRYRCRNTDCTRASFICNYTYRAYLPDVKEQIGYIEINGSGIRNTARVLKISPTTVIEILKKSPRVA